MTPAPRTIENHLERLYEQHKKLAEKLIDQHKYTKDKFNQVRSEC